MRAYELMTIHRPELAEADVRSGLNAIVAFLESRGSEVIDTDFWGKRRFSYEIDHVREGFYTVLAFRSDASVVDDLARSLQLADEVMRHKVVRLPE